MTSLDTVITQLRQERDRLNDAIAALENVNRNIVFSIKAFSQACAFSRCPQANRCCATEEMGIFRKQKRVA